MKIKTESTFIDRPRCPDEQHDWNNALQYCTKCGVLYDPKLEQLKHWAIEKKQKAGQL